MKNGISFAQIVFILMLTNGLMNHVLVIPMMLDSAKRDSWLSVLSAGLLYVLWTGLLYVLYSQLTDPEEIYKQNSTIEPIKLYRFISQKDEPDGVVFLPTISTNKKHWSENGKYKPKLEISGVSILQNEQFKAFLPRDELLGLRWLTRQTKRAVLGVEKNNKTLAIIVVEKPNAVIRPIIQNGQTTFRIKVIANGFITQYLQSGPIEVVEKEAAKKIEAEISSLFEKGLAKQIDTLQLRHTLYRRNPQEWQRLAVNNSLPLSPSLLDSIHVEVKLKNGGISKVKQ